MQLTADRRCAIFGLPERPGVCAGFMAEREVCGDSAEEAVRILGWWEQATACGGDIKKPAEAGFFMQLDYLFG